MRWFSSDLHFGHANISGYSGRPFDDVPSMDLTIVDLWNANVAEEDEVWILGDLVMGSWKSELAEHASRLNGQKVLVPGNHDRCWAHARKGAEAATELYEAAGFTIVHGTPTVRIDDSHVLLHHFPYAGDSHDSDRFSDHRPHDSGAWLLHGHVHEKWRQHGRQINVGIDAWGGLPVPEYVIADLIRCGPADRSSLPWPDDVVAAHVAAHANGQDSGRDAIDVGVDVAGVA